MVLSLVLVMMLLELGAPWRSQCEWAMHWYALLWNAWMMSTRGALPAWFGMFWNAWVTSTHGVPLLAFGAFNRPASCSSQQLGFCYPHASLTQALQYLGARCSGALE